MATRTRDLSDQVNGVSKMFETQEGFIPGTLEVHLNGVRQRRGVFFSEVGEDRFVTTEPPLVGDALSVQFEVVGPGDVVRFPVVVSSGIDPGRA